jgi:hypothetical protein
MTDNNTYNLKPFTKKELYLPGLGNYLNMREEEKMLQSYNNEFYSTLNSLKKTKFPRIIPENQNIQNYFYEYHANENASITSSTGQVWHTIEDAFKLNIQLKSEFIEINNHLKSMRKEVEDIETIKEFANYTKNIRLSVQNFLVDQKTETFKLVKDIAVLSKEKIDIQNKIVLALDKIKKLELEVGSKKTIFNHTMEDALKSYTSTENRFFEKDYDNEK